MTTVRRGAGFPPLAVLLGGAGAVLIALGVLGLVSPDAVDFAPVLRERLVASALVGSGAVFMAVEAVLVLVWLRRRRERG